MLGKTLVNHAQSALYSRRNHNRGDDFAVAVTILSILRFRQRSIGVVSENYSSNVRKMSVGVENGIYWEQLRRPFPSALPETVV